MQRACAKLDLRTGRYVLIPSTSGLKFKRRSEVPPGEAKLVKPGAKDAAVLTAGFKYAKKGLQLLVVICTPADLLTLFKFECLGRRSRRSSRCLTPTRMARCRAQSSTPTCCVAMDSMWATRIGLSFKPSTLWGRPLLVSGSTLNNCITNS